MLRHACSGPAAVGPQRGLGRRKRDRKIRNAASARGGSAQVHGTTPAVPVLGMVGCTLAGDTLDGDTLDGDTVVGAVVAVVGTVWQTSPQVTTGPRCCPWCHPAW